MSMFSKTQGLLLGAAVTLACVSMSAVAAEGGEQVDFTGDIAWNTAFFATGPGYAAKNM